MAATPFNASGPGSSFVFDIYNDGQALRSAPSFPGGPCNYTDQTLPRCGCRRFWSRLSLGGGFQDNNLAEICMCSHHACFHEDVQPGGQFQPAAATLVVGQENQKPRTNREPLSPVQGGGSFHIPFGPGTSMNFELLNFQSIGSHPVDTDSPFQIEDARSGQDSALPDTLNSWGNLLQSQPGHNDGLPPIPSQCLMPPAQAPSTASSSQARYLRPFAGKGLHTLNGDLAPMNEVSDVGADPAPIPGNIEPAKPPRADGRDHFPSLEPSQERPSVSIGDEAWQKLSNTVDSHEQRLDKLENASFSVASHEECHDKHEHVDVRVTELESRVEEVEKMLNDNGSVASSRRIIRPDGSPDDATASVISVATDATVLGPNRVEMYSQLQALQAQVSQLQAASLPSYTKPWELEVVFLPFPLKGVWMEAREFPSQRRSTGTNGDEWTQMPNTISRATPDPSSPKFQEWAGQSADSNWLLPRAFASGRVIDQRLKSRGLIKTVLVRGPDARSIHLAIYNAFDDVFRISSNAKSGPGSNVLLADFLGLRQPWVPLRKLHKDSRLRFLAPAEMATPALWDFTFLVSSVVMKATGTHRLYVTQPEAYLQDHPLGYRAFESGWSWQKLRELTRVYPDSQSSLGDLAVPEADAMEDCWAWNDRLDESPSAHSSTLSLRQHYQRRMSRGPSVTPSQQFFTGVQSPILSSSPAVARAQSPFIHRERHGSRPLHVRTNSLPQVAGAMASPSQSRRRVSAHTSTASPYERRSSPLISRASPRMPGYHSTAVPAIASAVNPLLKHRLGTRSPSLAPRNTPRWSQARMSRSPSLAPPGFQDDRERRTTPFFYATPHSDALPDYIYQRAGSRPPVAVGPPDGYDPDDEEMEDDFGDDQGSSTDPYDSEMTNEANDDARKQSGYAESSGFGLGTDDGDYVYEDEDEDELDGVDTDGGYEPVAWSGLGQRQAAHQESQERPRPEDIPWAGIEDRMSDGENVDPESQFQSQSQEIIIHEDEDVNIIDRDDVGGDAGSGLDSQPPSEYSSKQNAWPIPLASTSRPLDHAGIEGEEQDVSQGFHIHEDMSGQETQWA